MTLCTASLSMNASTDDFKYTDEKFADIQMLRYKVTDFEKLTLRQKILVYYLSEAALYGRDILFDQNGAYNLRIRKMLETVYCEYKGNRNTDDFQAMTTYLKRVWFSNGIHHHYGCEKFVPGFSQEFFRNALKSVNRKNLPLKSGQTVDKLCDEIFPIIFDPTIMPMRVNLKAGDDLIKTSAANYYGTDISQQEVEAFYADMRQKGDPERPVMYGLNSQLVKKDGQLQERVWSTTGMYGAALSKIVSQLQKALPYAESEAQASVIRRLIDYYISGNLKDFDQYCIEWVKNTDDLIDFTNGFTEVYGDPLGMKGSWEGFANFKNLETTARTEKLSQNAQWFEDNSPVAPQFKKKECKGISAKVITATILAGDLYPSTAIGINLPNSNWIRKEYGSKSVTIGNLTDAYNKAAHGNGFEEEFIADENVRSLIQNYGDICDDLHTDLHECLGHGSGKMLPGISDDSLRAYGSTIEEARADLFALYYLADAKLLEMGLTPSKDAYKSEYYSYMLNGLLTQLVRIKPGNNIEEAHMRNRALIARWAYEKGKEKNVVELYQQNGKTYLRINDYEALRQLFGRLLAEVQRVKSEGDYKAAHDLVEGYGVKVDPVLHAEMIARYNQLNIAPYKGFINPVYTAVTDRNGHITDVKIDYKESYEHQMLRYSKEYAPLPFIN
ncbi:MAG: dihydrofolate reductase [Prevotellaceae bacterium]|nr:dihydrofolate reductase [Prevotellaceae bacterium]